MTRDEAIQAIASAVEAAHTAYWAVCDAEGGVIDPAALGAPANLLDEAQATALIVEYLVQERDKTWAEARDLLIESPRASRSCDPQRVGDRQ